MSFATQDHCAVHHALHNLQPRTQLAPVFRVSRGWGGGGVKGMEGDEGKTEISRIKEFKNKKYKNLETSKLLHWCDSCLQTSC